MSSNDTQHFCVQIILPVELERESRARALEENSENALPYRGIRTSQDGELAPLQDIGLHYMANSLVPGQPCLALQTQKKWENGKTLRVHFLDAGTQYVRGKVQEFAKIWSNYANIYFDFVSSNPSDIRISFRRGEGSWSCVGIDCLSRPETEPTMNLGWLSDQLPESEFRRVVLHEFGHAIGCIHEHNQPNANINWNKPAVYEAYKRFGWSEAQVDFNIFAQYTAKEVEASFFDSTSIMEYPIPKGHTLDGFTVEPNDRLSSGDIEFIGEMYPKDRSTGPPSKPGTPIPPAPAPPAEGASSNLEIGIFETFPTLSSDPEERNVQTIVNFTKQYSSAPAFVIGLNGIDVDDSHNLRVRPPPVSLRSSQAVIGLNSSDDIWSNDDNSNLPGSGVSWLLLPPQDVEFQHGTFTTKRVPVERIVNFTNTYHSPPQVLVFFNALDLAKSKDCRIKTYASEVTTRGFKLKIETWSNTGVSEAGVSWIALPVGRQGVATGRFSTEDVRSSQTPQSQTQKTIQFGTNFSNPPKVFFALDMLNIANSRQTRVRLSIGNTSRYRMEWHIDSLGSTNLYAASAVYIAIDG
ncbi:hypothetical protein TWF106_009652 [Orbilia oligospora]|uniref:Peptidase metallopeptidase domain-containing protein n=1 Tax=Orbilia oligospora TaxID=2813651 RepID=A0A7C8UEN6_ORBOL|nr:hypothetical protein TWF106_009652 [Orbilia oligospora]